MRKNFFKKLAFALAAAMVVGSAAPAAGAAAKPALNQKAKNLYLNNEEVGKSFNFNIKNKVTGSKYKWTSSDTSIATVNSKNGVVTGKKVGKATISCKITLPTKKTQTLKATVQVKANATAVAIKNPTETVGIGENVYDFNRTLTASDATDYTRWFIDEETNTAGATVDDKGKITTTKAGEFTIVARTFQNKAMIAAGTNTSESEALTVKVVPTLLSAVQTHSNKVNVTFDDNMKEVVTKDNITLVNTETKANQYVKGVTFSEDGKVVTVETHLEFTNDAAYQVTYGEKSVDFTAKVGEVAKAVINTTVVQYDTETELDIALFDANGIDVTNGKTDDIEVTSDQGYLDKLKLTLYNIGDTAKVKATYHSGNYSSSGEEIIVTSSEVTIKAVKEVLSTGTFSAYTIIDQDESPDWDKVVHTLPEGNSDMKIVTKGTDKNGDELISDTNTDDVKFYTSDSNIILVNEDGTLNAIKEGNAYVKAVYGSTTQLLPITVGKEAKASSIKLDKTDVSLATLSKTASTSGKFVGAETTVDVKILDQYGNEMDAKFVDIEPTSSPKITTGRTELSATSPEAGKVKFETNTTTQAGTYKYKLKTQDRTATFTVTVKESDGIEKSRRLEISDSTIDAAISRTTDDNKYVDINVYAYDKNNVKLYVVDSTVDSNATLTVKLDSDHLSKVHDGAVKVQVLKLPTVSGSALAITGGEGAKGSFIDSAYDVATGAAIQSKTGTYTVEYTYEDSSSKTKTLKGQFVIKNTQSLPKFTQEKYNVETRSLMSAVEEAFTFKLSGNELTDIVKFGYKVANASEILSGDTFIKDGKFGVSITNVYIQDTFTIKNNTDINIVYKVPVNKTITVDTN